MVMMVVTSGCGQKRVDQLPGVAGQVHVAGESEQGQNAENNAIDELFLPRIQHINASV